MGKNLLELKDVNGNALKFEDFDIIELDNNDNYRFGIVYGNTVVYVGQSVGFKETRGGGWDYLKSAAWGIKNIWRMNGAKTLEVFNKLKLLRFGLEFENFKDDYYNCIWGEDAPKPKTDKEILLERFTELFPHLRLLAVTLDGFSHTVYFDLGDNQGEVKSDSHSAYKSFGVDRTLSKVFAGHAHYMYQNNAKQYVYIEPQNR